MLYDCVPAPLHAHNWAALTGIIQLHSITHLAGNPTMANVILRDFPIHSAWCLGWWIHHDPCLSDTNLHLFIVIEAASTLEALWIGRWGDFLLQLWDRCREKRGSAHVRSAGICSCSHIFVARSICLFWAKTLANPSCLVDLRTRFADLLSSFFFKLVHDMVGLCLFYCNSIFNG